MSNDEAQPALQRLDECERVVERLHKMCCEPDRSPRMQAILADIDEARGQLRTGAGAEGLRSAIRTLESIGSQIGYLQVACCASARMPLYADALRSLNESQIEISRSLGQGH